jgi:SRSO17 transposase
MATSPPVDSFETAKNELGLDHNETRSWHGWHRHVSFVMLVFVTSEHLSLMLNVRSRMAAIGHRANRLALQK